jgi:uncharacterized protein with NAD-binding domain and iron-sulfur cluster
MNLHILVVGAGVAGLSAAVAAARRGARVTLVDQSNTPGGSLARLPDAPLLFCGYHDATRSLLAWLGASEARILDKMSLEIMQPSGRIVGWRSGFMPWPVATVLRLMWFRGLPIRDRWRLINVIERTWEGDPPLPSDLDSRTAQEWLTMIGQSEGAQRLTWNPLAQFLTGDDLATVSVQAYLEALIRHFLLAPHKSGIFCTRESATAALCDPAVQFLKDQGATFHLGRTATFLTIDGQRLTGVRLDDGTALSADRYIVTLPHTALRALLPERLLTHYGYFQQLTHLTDSPKLLLHLTTGAQTSAPRLLLSADRTYDQIVVHPHHKRDARTTGVTLIATGRAPAHSLTDEQALAESRKDLACACPRLAQAPVLAHRIVRDQAACLSLRPGMRQWRPLPSGPIRNLFVGGAWTDTGWPSNLESAVVSGLRCAELALQERVTGDA